MSQHGSNNGRKQQTDMERQYSGSYYQANVQSQFPGQPAIPGSSPPVAFKPSFWGSTVGYTSRYMPLVALSKLNSYLNPFYLRFNKNSVCLRIEQQPALIIIFSPKKSSPYQITSPTCESSGAGTGCF